MKDSSSSGCLWGFEFFKAIVLIVCISIWGWSNVWTFFLNYWVVILYVLGGILAFYLIIWAVSVLIKKHKENVKSVKNNRNE